MIAPSGDCSLATVWPHGSSRGACSSSKPACSSSRAAEATDPRSATSNSILACGVGRSAGHLDVQAGICGLGQRPDPEGLAAGEPFAVEVLVAAERQSERVEVQPSACGQIGRDHCHGREELNLRAASSLRSACTRFNQARLP